jgi:hypothetical protein
MTNKQSMRFAIAGEVRVYTSFVNGRIRLPDQGLMPTPLPMHLDVEVPCGHTIEDIVSSAIQKRSVYRVNRAE